MPIQVGLYYETLFDVKVVFESQKYPIDLQTTQWWRQDRTQIVFNSKCVIVYVIVTYKISRTILLRLVL